MSRMYSPSPSHSTAFDDLIDPERAKILDSADAFLEQLEREEQEKRQEKKQKRQQSRVSGNFPIAPIEPQRSDSPPTNLSTSNHSSKENIETPVQNTHIDQHYSIARSSKREFPGYGIGPLESHRMPSKKSSKRQISYMSDVSESICTIPDSPPPEPNSFSSEFTAIEHSLPESPPPEMHEFPPGAAPQYEIYDRMDIPPSLRIEEPKFSRKKNSLLSPDPRKKRFVHQHQKGNPSFDKRFIQHQKDSPSYDRSVSRSRARDSSTNIHFRSNLAGEDRRSTLPPGMIGIPGMRFSQKRSRVKTAGSSQLDVRRKSAPPSHLVSHQLEGESEDVNSGEPESPPLTPVGKQTAGMIGWNQTFPKRALSASAIAAQQNHAPSISKQIHEGITVSTTRRKTLPGMSSPYQSTSWHPEPGSPSDDGPPDIIDDGVTTKDMTTTEIIITAAPVRTSIYNFEGLRLKKKYLGGDPVEVKLDNDWELGHIICFNLDDNTWSVKMFDEDDTKRFRDVKVRKPKLEANLQKLEDQENHPEIPSDDDDSSYDKFEEGGFGLNSDLQSLNADGLHGRGPAISVSSTFDFGKMKPSHSPGAPGESVDFGVPPSLHSVNLSLFPRKQSAADTVFTMDSGVSPTHTPPPPDEPIPVRMIEQFRNWNFDHTKVRENEDSRSSSENFPEIVDPEPGATGPRHKRDNSIASDITDMTALIPNNIGLFGAPPEKPEVDDALVAKLTAMDFTAQEASVALEMSSGDFDFALALLLSEKDAKQAQRAQQEEADQMLAIDMQPVIYDVTFQGPKFGFEILMGDNGLGASCGMLLSKFAKLNIVPGSSMIEVAEVDVTKKTLEEIRMLMMAQMTEKKCCIIKFSTTAKVLNKFKTRGNLKILVSAGEALYVSASYCTVSILDAELGTDRVKKRQEPSVEQHARLVQIWCAAEHSCSGATLAI